MPLLQAYLIDADIRDRPLRIDLLGVGIRQLVADDQRDHLRGNAQPPGHLLFVAADQQAEYLLLKAVGVAGVLALEGRDEELPVVAVRAAAERGLVDPEAGLPPQVQVPDHGDPFAELGVGLVLAAAAVAAAAVGQRPGDFKAVAVGMAVVGGDGDAGRQIDVDGNGRHDLPWLGRAAVLRCRSHSGSSYRKCRAGGSAENLENVRLRTLERNSPFF